MAVTQVNEGLHTTTISYEAGDTLAAVRALIHAFITGHGWELHETLTNQDVYKSLDTGGTPGIAAHYSYAELDYSVTDRLCLRQWLSWSAGVGTQRAQSTYYVSSSQNNAAAGTESQLGQPLSTAVNGSIMLNVARGRLYILGSIVGLVGNVANNGGTMVIERTRVHPSDQIGGAPGCMIIHTGQMLFAQTGVSKFKFAMPKDIAGGNNATLIAGDTGGFRVPEISEYFPYYPNNYHFDPPYMGGADAVDGSVNAGAVYPIVGCHTAAVTHVRFGALQGAARRYGSAPGDILTLPADAYGVPIPGGSPTEYIVVSGGIGLVR